jgi:fructose-bisphosphate aldolase class I
LTEKVLIIVYNKTMNKAKLRSTAQKMVAKGKGILAADESMGTIEKRLKSINTPSTETNRRNYRDLLLTTNGMEKFISGVILFDETLRQKTKAGIPFPKLLKKKGVLAGIKVDKGAKDLPFFPGEKITEGLDGLRERFAEYANLGAEFTKWRAVITIGKGIPTPECIIANAHALARYAALAQEAGIVPIVEPEVLMDGSHSLARCEEVTTSTLKALYQEMRRYQLYLPGTILKPNMVISGTKAKKQATVKEVAQATLRTFRKTVPNEVQGIVFLSGGLTPDEATERLDEINKQAKNAPWELSFSFGRALQQEALQTWAGKTTNVTAAQRAFYDRASLVASAREGKLSQTLS